MVGVLTVSSPQRLEAADRPVALASAPVPLEAVISTAELGCRASRVADYEAENRALVTLAEAMAQAPPDILQRLVETALQLCRADSAGVSILEEGGESGVFRWHALAGAMAPYVWGTAPRHFSPCGTVIDTGAIQLMRLPERHYTYLAELGLPVCEALLVPFAVAGKTVGTIWVVTHDESRRFDAEDGRLIGDLAKFAAAAYQTRCSVEEIRNADRRKDEFLATLSHELRNPLAAICAGVSLIAREDVNPEFVAKARSTLPRQVDQMARLLDDLLDVSRIARGKLSLRKEPVEVRTLLDMAIELVRPIIDAKHHELTIQLPPEPVRLLGDPVRLAQVIANLLTNAAKYTDPQGRIALRAQSDGRELLVRVTDNGVGIAKDSLKVIFEMFSQVDADQHRSQGGLGIGLALSKALLELHGGRISAHSEGRGKGSEFTVHLPLTPAPEQHEHEELLASTIRHRILIVDDHLDALDNLSMLLESDGHAVKVARDGREALQVAATFQPDIVLLDIALPHLNGYEVAERLRSADPNMTCTLIAVTGYGSAEDKHRAVEAGFDDHITKPVKLEMLADYLR